MRVDDIKGNFVRLKITKEQRSKTNYTEDIDGARPCKEYIRKKPHNQMEPTNLI